MINENDLLEPRKAYETILKEEHKENAEKYFDELAKKAGVDVEANDEVTKKYQSLKADESIQTNAKKKIQSKANTVTAFGIVCIVLSVIVFGVIAFLYNAEIIETWVNVVFGYVLPILLLGGGIALFIFKGVAIKPVIQKQEAIISRIQAAQREQEAIGFNQMKPLNDMFTWNMHIDVVNQTTPLIKMDKFFDFDRLEYLTTSFGYQWLSQKNTSTVHILSGTIIGNPFVIETQKVMEMGSQTYEGTLTITYRVRVPNGGKNGGYHYETRTQILHAYITKPKPLYNYEKKLSYGCDAAPDLSFSRKCSNYSTMDEKDQKKYIAAEEKKLDELTKKNLENNKNFTPLGNKQFEALFHAWDRDNEVQFRLLFTPLAQKNYLDLIKNKEPYGDDFNIIKDKKLSTVYTKHSQYVDYVGSPTDFSSFSLRDSKYKFVEFNQKFFQSFYFDMATLLSIPLFQQYPTDDFIFNKKVENNNTIQEIEAVANAFDESVFKPNLCSTEQILKAQFIRTEGIADRVKVTSRGFKTVEHVDYVPVMGKDGILHQVPVHWIEYVPVSKDTEIEVIHAPLTRDELAKKKDTFGYRDFVSNNVFDNRIIYSKEYFSFVVPQGRSYSQDSFNALLSKDE